MAWLPKQCVVVPFDFSELSAQAIESAREFVSDPSHLYAIYVLSPILATDPDVYWEVLDDNARRRHVLNEFETSATGKRIDKGNFYVEIGDPGRTITEFASSKKADLIVMPSHGRSGLSRLLLGSVAERVVRLAHCPVLILK